MLVLRLKLIETSIDNTAISRIKQYFVTLLAGAGIVVALDDVTLDIAAQGRRRLLSEMTITVSISLAPDVETGELVDVLSKPAALEATKTSFVGFGLTLTSLEVAQDAKSGAGSPSLGGGEIAAIIIGCLVGAGLLIGICIHLLPKLKTCLMERKSNVAADANKVTVTVPKPTPPVKPVAASHPAATASAAA